MELSTDCVFLVFSRGTFLRDCTNNYQPQGVVYGEASRQEEGSRLIGPIQLPNHDGAASNAARKVYVRIG